MSQSKSGTAAADGPARPATPDAPCAPPDAGPVDDRGHLDFGHYFDQSILDMHYMIQMMRARQLEADLAAEVEGFRVDPATGKVTFLPTGGGTGRADQVKDDQARDDQVRDEQITDDGPAAG